MSQSFNVYQGSKGTIEANLGLSGTYYDLFDIEGHYIGTRGTLAAAKAFLGIPEHTSAQNPSRSE